MQILKYIVYLFRLFVFCELYLRVAYFMAFEKCSLSSVLIPIPFALILSFVAVAPVFFVTVSYVVVLFFAITEENTSRFFVWYFFLLQTFSWGLFFFVCSRPPRFFCFSAFSSEFRFWKHYCICFGELSMKNFQS